MVFPCQVLQRSMALFGAQPEGPGPFLRAAALLVVHLERPNFSPRALPRAKTGSGAAVCETSIDPTKKEDGGEHQHGAPGDRSGVPAHLAGFAAYQCGVAATREQRNQADAAVDGVAAQ